MRSRFLGLIALLPAVAAAQQSPPTTPPPAANPAQQTPRAPASPFKPFAEVTRDAMVRPGIFDSYTKDDKLYLAIPKTKLNQDFLMASEVAQGIGVNFLVGGEMMTYEGNVVAIERHGDQLFLVQRPHRYTAKNDAAAKKSVDMTYGSSVLESAKIESFREDSAALIDVTGWFLGELSGIGLQVRAELSTVPGRPGQAAFDRTRSYIESVKDFPQNLNIRARLTFRPPDPANIVSVPDGRFVSVSVHTTFASLPEIPMASRQGDDRVGNFWSVSKDFSQDDSSTFVRKVNRWRLEPGEKVGDKYRPKKPIVYYIDQTIPVVYRKTMMEAVAAWNVAFEAAGWVDAIHAEMLPDGIDPEDIRYATLRYNTADVPGYGAIGPSLVDPRTGEILDADILFESTFFGGFRGNWKSITNPLSAAITLNQALGIGVEESERPGIELSNFASNFAAQGGLLEAALVTRGEMAPGDPVPDRYVMQAVKWATMHEVGHTLGLQHNFRSSASTPNAKLHDSTFAAQNGLYGSVMEYPSINIAPKGKPNGFYYTPNVGSSDRWAISYAYTSDDERAKSLARESSDKGHLYGNNSESGGPGALDPSINIWDLGDDQVEWGRERTSMIRDLLQELPAKLLTDNATYLTVTNGYQTLMNQYSLALTPVIKYLGGAYINRDHNGDPGARLPFENIPIAKQREALALLVDRVFAENALSVPQAVLQKMGPNRWLHWGSNTTFNGRLDFPYHESVLGLQEAVLGNLLNPFRLSRIRDGETKYGMASVVTMPEMMGALTRAIWTESWGPTRKSANATRRDLQRSYLDAMTQLIVHPSDRAPNDARAVARMQLTELKGKIVAALATPTSLDAYSRAHLEESKARIAKVLDASLEADRR